jgi:hypothetical protein
MSFYDVLAEMHRGVIGDSRVSSAFEQQIGPGDGLMETRSRTAAELYGCLADLKSRDGS